MSKVFVTGSTRGFGLVLAKQFKQAGYEIVLNGRGCPNFSVKDDFCQKSVGVLTAEEFAKYAPGVIVNNAFDKSSCMTSLAGQVNVLKEAIKYFETQEGGTIINIGSSKSIVPDVDFPEYAMAKYGLRGYSESVKFQCYQKGIDILDVYPGAINVGMAAWRDDVDKLIDAKELADYIVKMCNTDKMVISSIQINRKWTNGQRK